MQTIKKTFSSREDYEKWMKDNFGMDAKMLAANAPKTRFQEYWDSLPKYDAGPSDECCDSSIGCQFSEPTSPEPKPAFKHGTAMVQTGIYVDENGVMWHVDPFEGTIDLIVADDD